MEVMKPSILDRVKATFQSVFARHQPSDLRAGSETSNTNTAAPESEVPETGTARGAEPPTGAEDVDSEPPLPWLTGTQPDIFQQIERGTTTERRFVDRVRILLNEVRGLLSPL